MPRRLPTDDLAVTLDEIEPVRVEPVDEPHFAAGSGNERPVTGRVTRYEPGDPYFDADRDDPRAPRNVDLADRVTALEQGMARKSTVRKWAERALSFLGGSALVGLAWVMTKVEASGDAKATARAREETFRWLVDTVRTLDRRDALQQGQIDSLTDRLRYPMQGPPVAPRTEP